MKFDNPVAAKYWGCGESREDMAQGRNSKYCEKVGGRGGLKQSHSKGSIDSPLTVFDIVEDR